MMPVIPVPVRLPRAAHAVAVRGDTAYVLHDPDLDEARRRALLDYARVVLGEAEAEDERRPD